VPVPDEIAQSLIEGDNKRVICSIDLKIRFPAALLKNKEYWFVLVNKENREKAKIEEGQKLEVTLEKDHSEYGHEMPEELQVLLDQDEKGSQHFFALTKGKQRALIYLVGKVKNSNSRLSKSLAIIEHLKEAQGKLDFRKLNEKIKYFNNSNYS
jgi:hypothetical protein